ncbi:hypothetical protein JAAARDRAFT_203780 [Jaapia argillacea MUCL 33604]|uniref:PIPK domain-containing protein n=1 Tax=Jaapia argillacea MUCL 33604 TaxID=933084 RepID=A0A067Q6V4_9AGAM|nr:hypothetical protein JAAARDRAFT_203780 [Jaapia argillacea MUCL 33604]
MDAAGFVSRPHPPSVVISVAHGTRELQAERGDNCSAQYIQRRSRGLAKEFDPLSALYEMEQVAQLKVDEDEYTNEVLSRREPFGSAGLSGSLFFQSADSRYLLKSLEIGYPLPPSLLHILIGRVTRRFASPSNPLILYKIPSIPDHIYRKPPGMVPRNDRPTGYGHAV